MHSCFSSRLNYKKILFSLHAILGHHEHDIEVSNTEVDFDIGVLNAR